MSTDHDTLEVTPLPFKSIKMKTADANAWLSALRSGEYKQTTGNLNSKLDDAYCCLGVLEHCLTGEVEVDEHECPLVLPSEEWLTNRGISFANEEGIFSSDGCFVTNPIIGKYNPHGVVTASEANDLYAEPFASIANLLEFCIEKY